MSTGTPEPEFQTRHYIGLISKQPAYAAITEVQPGQFAAADQGRDPWAPLGGLDGTPTPKTTWYRVSAEVAIAFVATGGDDDDYDPWADDDDDDDAVGDDG